MDSQSILHRTLWLFGGAFAAALAVLAFLIWFTMRKGRRRRGYDGDGALRSAVRCSPSPIFTLVALRLQLLEERRVEPLTRLDIVHRDDQVVAGWNRRRACTRRRRRSAP